jgi:uncharacterized protein (DUF305 family)
MSFNWKRFFMMLTLSMLVAFAVSCGSAQPGTAPHGTDAGTAEIDQMFIDMMVPHHEGALEMAKIAQERGEHPEITAMAEAIIRGQTPEIEQMKAWRQEWYGSSETPPMSAMPMLEAMEGMGGMGHTMDMAADVEALRKADEPFDKAFIEAMIVHHQSAIDTARLAQQQASRQEIKDMAGTIIAAQQAEIDQMNAWMKEWYP